MNVFVWKNAWSDISIGTAAAIELGRNYNEALCRDRYVTFAPYHVIQKRTREEFSSGSFRWAVPSLLSPTAHMKRGTKK